MQPPAPFEPPERVLLGPGPSNAAPSVLAALSRSVIGHLDPAFLGAMDALRAMLRTVLGTANELTLAMSGTGSAGMETLFVNAIERGDRVVVGVNGVFGGRMAEVARRLGADVSAVEAPWGRAIDPDDLRRTARQGAKVLAVVHAETSTGVRQDLAPLRAIADEAGALLFVDCVTSLGGEPIAIDALGIDAAYSATQKCLSCPPGLAPVTFSDRARAAFAKRRTPPSSWYLDLALLARYWGEDRVYHHTAPTSMLLALHEALRLVLEETLPARVERHRRNALALAAGLEAMGLELPVPPAERLAPLTLVRAPAGIDERRVRAVMLDRYGVEIGAGLGAFAGKAWRIGLMGASSSRRNVMLCLATLGEALREQGFESQGDPLRAAAAADGSA